MTIPCTCRACGNVSQVEWSQVGREITCSKCGRTSTVPAPMETSGPAVAPTVLKFACPSCGRKYSTKPELAGKKIRCGACNTTVKVPQPGETATVAQSSQAVPKVQGATTSAKAAPRPDRGGSASIRVASGDDDSGDSSFLEELASIEGVKASKRAGAVLPSRSEAMEEVRQKVAEQEAVEAQKQATKARKKKRKKNTGFFDPKETLQLVSWVLAVVAGLAFLAWGYPHFRFPLGGILCIVGFIVYLLGWASLKQRVAEEGPLKAILFRFFPPYQWWFVATHWADTKDFVAFFAAGFVILSIGGAVIKSSPTGKKAAESERAYQKAKQGSQGDVPSVLPKGNADEE